MKNLTLLALTLLLCLSGSTVAQKMSPPPASMDPDDGKNLPAQSIAPKRVDLAQVQRDADALARTAQTIPSDVANVRAEANREALETLAGGAEPVARPLT